METAPRFVVASTGRSGSGYISEVLTRAGIKCGHEAYFNPFGERTEGLVGDSSWCAVPDIHHYPGVVFHQVRHPLDVITSLVRFPTDPEIYRSWQCRLFDDPGDPIVYGMLDWITYNRRIEEYAVTRWQVERVDLAVLRCVSETLDLPLTDPEDALASVPKDWNRHRPDGRLGWWDLPDGALKNEMQQMAVRYGYG